MSNLNKPSPEQIDKWIAGHEKRLGLSLKTEAKLPTATKTTIRVLVDTDAARLARAHYGADALITADDLRYALPPLPVVAKGLRSDRAPSRRASVPRILLND